MFPDTRMVCLVLQSQMEEARVAEGVLQALMQTEAVCGGLSGKGPKGSYVLMLDLQLVELFGKDEEVWSYWKRCVTG